MKLSAGKWLGLRRLADASGRFKITAVDQRPPIQNEIRARRGSTEAPWKDVADVKRVLAESLAAESTALLMDPLDAWPRAHGALQHGQGLMLTLEHVAFEETLGGRRSSLIPEWTTAKIKRVGADGVKLLAWYRPDASKHILEHQQDFVRRVGQDCIRYDIPFLLELLVYPLPNEAPDVVERHKSKFVLDSVREFAKPEYAVDLFKLESPVTDSELGDPDAKQASPVQQVFMEMGNLAGCPWVMLSAGTTAANFRRILKYAYRAGASGFLAGRAIWWKAFTDNFPDLEAMRGALLADGLNYLRDLNTLTDATAIAWTAHPVFDKGVCMAGADHEFALRYEGF